MSAGVLESPGRHRFARFSAASAFFVLFAGGMVTSTGSALAVPDWPLAYGQYFPEMTGGGGPGERGEAPRARPGPKEGQ